MTNRRAAPTSAPWVRALPGRPASGRPRVLLALLLVGWFVLGALSPHAYAESPAPPSPEATPTCAVVQAPLPTDESTTAPTDPTAPPTPDDTGTNWLWTLGGILVVLALFFGWRFLISARR